MRSSFKGTLVLIYAGVAYAGFAVTALWALGFLADAAAPVTVDGGVSWHPWMAVAADTGLFLLFATQHSVMARAGFKLRLARLLPAGAERSTFVLATSVALLLLFWLWRPLPAAVWHVTAQPAAALIWALYLAGWVVAVSATFMVDHLDFLGLRQARRFAAGIPYEPPSFTQRWLYGWMRHPMMLGLLIAFWATPVMTAGHLLFAAAGSAYIAVGIKFEERDLIRQLGDAYRGYARAVPAVIPAPRRARARQGTRASG